MRSLLKHITRLPELFFTSTRVLLVSLLLVLMLSSCRSTKVLTNTTTTVSTETIETKDTVFSMSAIEYRDTTIVVSADTAAIMALVDCDDKGKVNLPKTQVKSSKATVTLEIVNNELVAVATCDSLEAVICVKDSIINNYKETRITKSKVTTTENTEQVAVKFIPDWVKALAFIGFLALAYIGFKLFMFFKSFTPAGAAGGIISKIIGK